MKSLRLSIAHLMSLVGLVGLACAATRLPIWDGELTCGLVLPGLATTWASVQAVRHQNRTFWVGFAVTGSIAMSAFAFAYLSGGFMSQVLDTYTDRTTGLLGTLIPAFNPGAEDIGIASGLTFIWSAPQLILAVLVGAASQRILRGMAQTSKLTFQPIA